MCVRARECVQGLFSFNHCFTCVLKTLSSVNVLISDDNLVHSLVLIFGFALHCTISARCTASSNSTVQLIYQGRVFLEQGCSHT